MELVEKKSTILESYAQTAEQIWQKKICSNEAQNEKGLNLVGPESNQRRAFLYDWLDWVCKEFCMLVSLYDKTNLFLSKHR